MPNGWREQLGRRGVPPRAPVRRGMPPPPPPREPEPRALARRGEPPPVSKREQILSTHPQIANLTEKGRAVVEALKTYRDTDLIMSGTTGESPPRLGEIIEYLASPEGKTWVETKMTPQWVSSFIAGAKQYDYQPRTGEWSLFYPAGLGELEKAVYQRRTGWPYIEQAAGETYAQYVERMRGMAGRGAPTVPMAGVAPTAGAPAQPYWGPQYDPTWYQFLQEQELPWERKKWTESLFPSLVRKFEATQPPIQAYGEEARWGAARRMEAGWAEYLKEYPFEEEWYERPGIERGERPARFAPMIRTVSY